MTTRFSGKTALLSLGMALVLGACSASVAPGGVSNVNRPTGGPSRGAPADSAAATTSGSDASAACSIVTPAAVSAATGFAVAKSAGAGGICSFQNADTSKYLTVQTYGSQADMAPMLQAEPGGEHIAGLGDDAFWSQLGGLLFVRKGDHGIAFLDPDLGSSSSTNTSGRDALVALARTALPNL